MCTQQWKRSTVLQRLTANTHRKCIARGSCLSKLHDTCACDRLHHGGLAQHRAPMGLEAKLEPHQRVGRCEGGRPMLVPARQQVHEHAPSSRVGGG